MGIVYPTGLDTFSVPSDPADTSLSSAGSSARDHTQSHQDLGLAVMALQANAAQLSHDHSGGTTAINVTQGTAGALVANDVQTVALSGSPTGGTFTLTFYTTTTSAIAYNATASTVQTALEAVVSSGNITVSGSAGGPYTLIFTGSLAAAPQPVWVGDGTDLTPSGGVSVVHNVTGSSGSSAVQVITMPGGPTGGTFTLTWGGYTTGALGYNASAATVQAALIALTSVGTSNVTVSGSAGGPYTVTFAGSLTNNPQSLIVATSSLTGGTFATSKLDMVNTHQNSDIDVAIWSQHHSLGTSPTQAAPGNHAHDYDGPSIFNKPFIVCTSTTRPTDPFPGLTIWETDTNCARVWGIFNQDNILNSGIDFEYNFNTNNSATSLDPAIFNQVYVVGTSPADGAMGAPEAGNCEWYEGANETCRCIATAVVEDNDQFVTDQQEITFASAAPEGSSVPTYGTYGLYGKAAKPQAGPEVYTTYGPEGIPSTDVYLRMSSDGQSYVRFGITYGAIGVSYTTSGPSGEVLLSGVPATTATPGTSWTCKAIGSTYTIYSDGAQILSCVDYLGAINVGADYRHWGIGMQGCPGVGAQFNPYGITSVIAQDIPSYSTEMIWQLISWGATPHVRAEAAFEQEIYVSLYEAQFPVYWSGIVVGSVQSDWAVDNFMNLEVSQTDIIIKEAGHYSVHASVSWNPNAPSFDHSMVAVTVNSQDIGRKNWEFVRGNGYSPGFAQTNELYFTYYFAVGDVVRVEAANNSNVPTYTYYNATPPYTQLCYVELDFQGP